MDNSLFTTSAGRSYWREEAGKTAAQPAAFASLRQEIYILRGGAVDLHNGTRTFKGNSTFGTDATGSTTGMNSGGGNNAYLIE